MKNFDSVGKNNQSSPQVNIQQTIKNKNSVNLISVKTKKGYKGIFKKVVWTIAFIAALLSGMILAKVSSLSGKIFVGQKTTFFGNLVGLIRGGGDNQKLTGEDLGQINFLLLGVGGEGHEGPYLTDTMLLAQIRPDISQITLTSIPRDYLTTLPDKSQQKINAAFAYGLGKDKDWDKAGAWAREVVENMSGLKIPYFAVVDFSGFEKAIDRVGGVDVTIDRTFTDYQYPNSSYGYLPPQTFTQGPAHFNGEKALIFARSRHAAGIEGSDFSRSNRQQKIIESFKQKLFSLNIIKDAGAISELVNIFADHFHTNMTPGQLLKLYNIVKDKDMKTLPLSLDPETNLVCNYILASNSAFVLVPCKSEDDIKNFFKNSFSAAKIKEEQAVVWLASSTGDKAAYNSAMRELTNAGVMVYNLSYTKDNLPNSLVYQVNSKSGTAEFIKNQLNATEVTLPPPGVTINKDKVDIIVVLGENAKAKPTPVPYIPPPAKQNSTTTPTSTSTPIQSTSTPLTNGTSTPK